MQTVARIFALSALVLGASAVAQPALAGSKSATFQATFVVLESCAVEKNATQQHAKPDVRCQFATPYQVSQQVSRHQAAAEPAPAQAPQQTSQDAVQNQVWTVTF